MAYSDAERAEALIRLATNKYNYDKTAEETGITTKTLRRWDKNVPKKGVFELLERAVWQMLASVPSEWKNGQDWAIALGILIDKLLLMQGEPTQRSESIVHGYRDLSDEEKRIVTERARAIIGDSIGFGDGKRSGDGDRSA